MGQGRAEEGRGKDQPDLNHRVLTGLKTEMAKAHVCVTSPSKSVHITLRTQSKWVSSSELNSQSVGKMSPKETQFPEVGDRQRTATLKERQG